MAWVQAIIGLTAGHVIAVDGKQVHGSENHATGRESRRLIRARATANQVGLGEVTVDEVSNTITALPCLLSVRDVSGCLGAMDALGTQTEIAKPMVAQGSEYLFVVTQNQGRLDEALDSLLADVSRQHHGPRPFRDARPVARDRDGWRFVCAGQLLPRHSRRICGKIAGGRGYRTGVPRLPFITTSPFTLLLL